MKVAIVHDWFASKTGGELCVEQLLLMFPQADVFTTVEFLTPEERRFLDGHRVTTSFIQRLPGARKRYRTYLPLMPIAVEQFDMTGYDLVISTSSAVAKGVITGPDQVHIAYTLSPIRYAWDLQETYLRESGSDKGMKGRIARSILHYMRMWDVRTAHGVDHFVAISHFIARRIRKVYRRESTVIYPPVNLDRFALVTKPREEFYVTMSRLVPYKRIPLIVEAFAAMPHRRLVVIGDGPDMAAAQAAAGPNVTLMGRQPDEVVVDHLQRAKAFLFAAEEDFGIAPLEAQACGTPVIAYGKGGALETIRGRDGSGQSGVFFAEQSVASIFAAVEHLDARLPEITPEACRANAERFSTERFHQEIGALVERAMAAHRAELAIGTGADAPSHRIAPQAAEQQLGLGDLRQVDHQQEVGRP